LATSGNTIDLMTRDEVINAALRKLVVIGEGVTASANQLSTGAEALNIIVAEFRTLGMSVWARSTYDLTLVAGQSTYVFGVGQAVPIPYPVYIYDILVKLGPNFDSQIEMQTMPIVDFDLLPTGSDGTPVNFNYQQGNNIGTLKVWPTPDASVPTGSYLRLTYQRPFEVFNSATDDIDFPQEWANALIYHLALALCDEYGVPDTKLARIERLADKHLATALSNSNEQGSLFITPDWKFIEP
jgi:hypothetical protein